MKKRKEQSAYEIKLRNKYGYTTYGPLELIGLATAVGAAALFILQGCGFIKIPF